MLVYMILQLSVLCFISCGICKVIILSRYHTLYSLLFIREEIYAHTNPVQISSFPLKLIAKYILVYLNLNSASRMKIDYRLETIGLSQQTSIFLELRMFWRKWPTELKTFTIQCHPETGFIREYQPAILW